jgi:4-amino-4-deoxy-L-arabinose transferase-like glycosyltransferase
VVPIFEAPDEPAHWDYVRYLRLNKKLPIYSPYFVEANSPPLYYLVVAPFAGYSDIPPQLFWNTPNSHVVPALPRYFQNSYLAYAGYWPIRTVRLVTALISLITIVFCYGLGVEATGRETTGLLAAGLAAFLPQFTFRGMNVSNDAMVTALCSVVLYLIVRMVKRGCNRRLLLACAVAMSAAFLSKTSALILPVPFAFAVLTESAGWREKAVRTCVLFLSVGLSSPWLIRNKVLYGDLLARKAMYIAVAPLISEKSITSPYFIHTFPTTLASSFVGVFGWGTLPSPTWVYYIYGVLGALGLLGFLYGIIHRRVDPRLAVILIVTPFLSLLVVIYINLMFEQAQGRYLFPSLPALALVAAIGLENLPIWSERISLALVFGLALLNVYIVLRVVLPGYWPPPAMAFLGGVKGLTPAQLDAGPADELVMSKAAGQFIINADAPADQYNYFTFTLKGAPDHGIVTGALYLDLCPGQSSKQHKIQFNWMCDGTAHAVIVPLWTYPEWAGRLAQVTVDPVDASVDSYPDLTVHIGAILLVSSLTSTRGP